MLTDEKIRVDFAKRLDIACKQKGLPEKGRGTQLASVCKVTPKAVSKWLNAETMPSTANIYLLAKFLAVTPEWLTYGIGNVIPAAIGTTKVPLISYVQAGAWTGIDDFRETCGDYEYILTDLDVSGDAFALKIEGDSMEPEFIAGDIVIIDPKVEPHAGEFVAAINGDYEATFKKYRPLEDLDEYGRQHFELVPLNPDWHSMSSLKQEIRIIGTMVEHRIYRRKR
ncbi:LexA family protein [Actinobacillus pleuropneumoniae]|uniref:Helix-turn-helix domain-containing protein n=1 Tax=Actinobacillus pleuropneumoniae TaxID=715 RepID=A0ABM6X2J5_ACTPL|nr:XRE family transcriptional regulator [Actinobacillus pleuropneumoniae]ASU16456.1 putative HTH-type transcriptional regulator [Actinobacillus pleuropneumoniae]AWG94920.1 helix-turn-helix domain-containing protein [Actinobacillus pleuropneumoniae serovar 1 str. 4074]AXA20992.1 helix-turn-helix domain-containing protein [Actinobacillus pleuropneumoniae]EFM94683.1 Possible LexA family repressor/S24 family protease [Actinobacillus pleuropneumoniae serovar 9 str. CVJ13261]EFM98966.1 Possible LexA